MMSAIIGPNNNPRYQAAIGAAHGERAVNWSQLTDQYKEHAILLHFLALGEHPAGMNDIGPIYVRQALAMQKTGMVITK